MKINFNHLNGYIGITVIGIKDRNIESIIIPERINGYPVTAIGNDELWWLSQLESITIPKSVISIHPSVFYGSPNINTVNGELIENDFVIINNRFIFDRNYVFLIKYQLSEDYVISHGVHLGFIDKIERNRNFRIWQLIMWIIKKIYRCHGEI